MSRARMMAREVADFVLDRVAAPALDWLDMDDLSRLPGDLAGAILDVTGRAS